MHNCTYITYTNYTLYTSYLQSSNAGSLLFPLYINDLPSASSIMSIILFADDTLYSTPISLPKPYFFQTVNAELCSITEWFAAKNSPRY